MGTSFFDAEEQICMAVGRRFVNAYAGKVEG